MFQRTPGPPSLLGAPAETRDLDDARAPSVVPVRKDFVNVDEREAMETLQRLGFDELDARTLADHFLAAERRGKRGHGFSRVAWLATRPFEVNPSAEPLRLVDEPGYQRWDGYWARKLADAGLVAAVTATSPPRLGHPDGGPRLAGTNPLAIAIPTDDGQPLVSD